MKVIVTLTACTPKAEINWPKGFPIPREGDEVEVPGIRSWVQNGMGGGYDGPLFVRHVTYYPHGDNAGNEDPFVYLVIGPRRKESW